MHMTQNLIHPTIPTEKIPKRNQGRQKKKKRSKLFPLSNLKEAPHRRRHPPTLLPGALHVNRHVGHDQPIGHDKIPPPPININQRRAGNSLAVEEAGIGRHIESPTQGLDGAAQGGEGGRGRRACKVHEWWWQWGESIRSWPRRDFSSLGRREMEVAHLGRAWNGHVGDVILVKKAEEERRDRAPTNTTMATRFLSS